MSSDQSQSQRIPCRYIIEDVCWAVDDTVLELSRKDELAEVLKRLLNQEETFRGIIAVVYEPAAAASRIHAPPSWRSALCTWAYSVVDQVGLDREVVTIAMDLFDLVVSSQRGTMHPSKKDHTSFALASLYIAVKIFASRNPRHVALELSQLMDAGRGEKIQAEDLEYAESLILLTLNGAAVSPTRLAFVAAMIHLCPGWKTDQSQEFLDGPRVLRGIYRVARHVVEISAFEAKLGVLYKPSMIAYSAILCAMEALQSHLDFPYYARVRYLINIAEVSGLMPNCADVLRVKMMLKDACPMLGNGDELILEFLDIDVPDSDITPQSGRSSPAGVADR